MFTKSQEEALEKIAQFIVDDEQIYFCLSGSPGTGKSFLIQEGIAPLIKDTKYTLQLTAMTNKAAGVIGGITIHKLLNLRMTIGSDGVQRIDKLGACHRQNEFIIIDEASMMDKVLWDIIATHTTDCKILLVGDKYQLPAVKLPVDVFEVFKDSSAELKEVVRQKDQDFLNIIGRAKLGVINKEFLDVIPTCDCIKKVTLVDKAQIKDLLKSFDAEKDKVLCYKNETVVSYNHGMRKLQGKTDTIITGDTVVARNYCELKVCNKTISTIGTETYHKITAISDPFVYSFDSYEIKLVSVNFNDVKGTWLCAYNWYQYNELLKLTAREKDWRNYWFLKEQILDIRTAEACTIHCSQGSTYDRVFIDMNDLRICKQIGVKTRLLYVALSRARNEVYIYDNRS